MDDWEQDNKQREYEEAMRCEFGFLEDLPPPSPPAALVAARKFDAHRAPYDKTDATKNVVERARQLRQEGEPFPMPFRALTTDLGIARVRNARMTLRKHFVADVDYLVLRKSKDDGPGYWQEEWLSWECARAFLRVTDKRVRARLLLAQMETSPQE